MEFLAPFEQYLMVIVHSLKLVVECLGTLVIATGVVQAIIKIVRSICSHQSLNFTSVRLTLAKYLALALEFQLAADILSTAVAPTWDDIGQLAVIAIVRTSLNYFLIREMHQETEEVEAKQQHK